MRSVETQPVTPLASIAVVAWQALGDFIARAASKLARCVRPQYDDPPAPEGHAWTDTLEREVNDHAAMCRRLRF